MHILIVEDRPEDRELITRRLRRHFGNVQLTEASTADSLHQALEDGPFDLILTDYEMGWTNGLQVLHQVKARFPDTPVIMFTESGNEEIAAEGMRTGLSDYLLKKHLERLPAALQASLERAELQRKYEQAVEELRRSEERYRTVAGAVVDLAYQFRVEPDGQFVAEWLGGNLVEVTGYNRDELAALGGLGVLTHPEDQALLHEAQSRLLRGEPTTSEYRIVTRSGEVHWLHVVNQPVWDPAEGRVVRIYGGARDVTAHHLADEVQRRMRDELEERVQERTAELAQVNQTLLQQTQELQDQREELAAQAEELRQQTDELVANNQEREELLTQVEQARRLSEALNRVDALLSATFDIKTVMQEILFQSTRALGTDTATIAWREDDGWVTTDAYGLPQEAGRHYTELEARWAAQLAQEGEVLAIDDLEVQPHVGAMHARRQGLRAAMIIPLLLEGRPVALITLGSRSGPFHFDPARVDFSRKLATSLALAMENERLHEQTRRDVETRATLLREVNHRVKNNLAAIVGLLYAQLDRPDLSHWPEYRVAIQELTRRVEGLSIVHSMLSSSQWQPLRLDDLAERILRSALQAVPPEQLKVQVQSSPVLVSPDQAHTLALVINELALNVAKHASPDGRARQIHVESAQEEGNVVLTVHDDGPGYPEEVLALQRSGVGLDLIRNLVTRNLRGQLRLSNQGGAVTEVRFPPAEAATRKAA